MSLAAIAVAGASTPLFLYAGGTPWLFWSRALSGFAIGLTAGAATAWITELDPTRDRGRAGLIVTSSNFFGLAIGPLLAGLLAQYAPHPLALPFVIYLALVLTIALPVAWSRDTVETPDRGVADLSLSPRLDVPRRIRAAFLAPAVTGFGAMALVGFYAALVPSILADNLRETSHAVAGLVIFELALVVALTILATWRVESRTAMMAGLALMPPAVALLVAAQGVSSLELLLLGTLVSGIASALGYRGSLQVVNEIAPDDRRAEVASSYFVCAFTGNALPVIGVGVLSRIADPMIASIAFALTIGAFAVAALIVARRDLPRKV